jgi:hypothetical protein
LFDRESRDFVLDTSCIQGIVHMNSSIIWYLFSYWGHFIEEGSQMSSVALEEVALLRSFNEQGNPNGM